MSKAEFGALISPFPGIRTAPIDDHPILRRLFAATRQTESANPTTTAVIAALRTAARRDRATYLP